MKRLAYWIAWFLWGCQPAMAEVHIDAVVRIPSHGISGAIIETRENYVLILTCAHGFEGKDRTKAIVVDVPCRATPKSPMAARPRIVKLDYQKDLALIQMDVGPFPYVLQVAPRLTRPRNCRSLGHDNMVWPLVDKPAMIMKTEGSHYLTDTKPWHGRSGGPLVDIETEMIVGVTHAYEPPQRQGGRNVGVYISLETICNFLEGKAAPIVQERREPRTPPIVIERREPGLQH